MVNVTVQYKYFKCDINTWYKIFLDQYYIGNLCIKQENMIKNVIIIVMQYFV